MSTTRGILLVSAGLAALGVVGVMVADGRHDSLQQLDGFRSANRRAPPSAPTDIPTPRPSALAPAPPADPPPQTVVVTLPTTSAFDALPQTRPIVGDRLSPAQALQGELQRVGCYSGSIDGVWTPLSQKAMKAFLERVNAQLPIDEPDYVLLALVKGRQDMVCGKPCPTGQSLTADNACAAAKERAPAVFNPPTIAADPSILPEARITAASQGGGPNPAATSAKIPAGPASALGATPPALPQKQKASANKASLGTFGPDVFKRQLQTHY